MDWSNERYVRVYTRDTTTWKLLDWRARTVLLHLFRKVDRAGVLDVGEDGLFGLAAVLELPMEVVEPGIEQLARSRGQSAPTVARTATAFVLPRFLEAQEAAMSDSQRKRESRSRRRDLALKPSHGVTGCDTSPNRTIRDETEPIGHETGRNGHSRSQDVTPILSDPNRSDPIRSGPSRDREVDFFDRPNLSGRDPRFRYVPSDAGPKRFMIFNGDEYLLHVEEQSDGSFREIAE